LHSPLTTVYLVRRPRPPPFVFEVFFFLREGLFFSFPRPGLAGFGINYPFVTDFPLFPPQQAGTPSFSLFSWRQPLLFPRASFSLWLSFPRPDTCPLLNMALPFGFLAPSCQCKMLPFSTCFHPPTYPPPPQRLRYSLPPQFQVCPRQVLF